MSKPSRSQVAIVGGGPAGSVAALCLRKLGREAVVFERESFPRYRIGESLLPGTMSILSRLGVVDRIEAAGFPKKRAATFLWGREQRPFSFTFSTPKTAPWVFDHAYQVTRAEYDRILLDAARDRGAEIREAHQALDIEAGSASEPPAISYRNGSGEGRHEAEFVIDATGGSGLLARKHGLRRWDPYYRNMAVWSYFRGGKRYAGDLEGNIFSVSFPDGWIWIIPQKDDMYSVGVVTGVESAARIKELGPEEFYRASLARSEFASRTLATAERVDEVRVIRDISYDATSLAVGRAFLCGDSACFIDPLFSQGVHLATYSAMLASAAIDYLIDHPDDAAPVRAWYDDAYRSAYNRYHKFLSSFYFHCDEPDSAFWSNRRIDGAGDRRFQDKEWFATLAGQESEGMQELESGAQVLRSLWDHGDEGLSEEFDETTLSLRRVRWASDLFRDFRRMARIRWTSKEARLIPSFKVHPTTFRLERKLFLGDEAGRRLTAYPLTEGHRALFAETLDAPLSYQELTRRLKEMDEQPASPTQIVARLLEDGFLQGLDENGEPVRMRFALRFGGVGADDDLI